jgi:hypothetical protein
MIKQAMREVKGFLFRMMLNAIRLGHRVELGFIITSKQLLGLTESSRSTIRPKTSMDHSLAPVDGFRFSLKWVVCLKDAIQCSEILRTDRPVKRHEICMIMHHVTAARLSSRFQS